MLKKLFLAFVALILILFGSLMLMMGYVFNNPEKVFSALGVMTDKFVQSADYNESEEFFIQGIDTLQFASQRADVSVIFYDGANLKVSLHGKIPGYDSGPYIMQTTNENRLSIQFQEPLPSHFVQWSVNGEEVSQESNSELKADIYIPLRFKKTLNIVSREGSVNLQLPPNSFYELNLQSVSGVIQNDFAEQTLPPELDAEEIGKISISTEKGAISVKPL